MSDVVLAYLDPGTGSLLLSFIIGSSIGATLFLRNTMCRLVNWVCRKNHAAESTTATDESAAAEQPVPHTGRSN